MVRLIAQGEEIVPAAWHTLRLLAEHLHPDGRAVHNSGTVRLFGAALELLGNTPARAEIFWQLGEGWTGDEALAIGVYAAGAASSFEDAVRLAANHDGDSDSPASIAGQLYGARHGILAVPHAWVRRLDVLNEALEVTRRFLADAGGAGLRPTHRHAVNALKKLADYPAAVNTVNTPV